jgi:uncharacterized Zn finger protein
MNSNETSELVGLETVAARDTTAEEPPAPQPVVFAVGECVHIDGQAFKIVYMRADGTMTLEPMS